LTSDIWAISKDAIKVLDGYIRYLNRQKMEKDRREEIGKRAASQNRAVFISYP